MSAYTITIIFGKLLEIAQRHDTSKVDLTFKLLIDYSHALKASFGRI